MLNSFFSTCFNRSQPALEVIDSLDYSLVDECPDDILCQRQKSVNSYLMSFDVTKASGSDGISARMLKETAMHISPSLTRIFNLSVKTGTFPSLWKKSNIVPIPKSGDNQSPTNYRPIPLLPTLGKLLEN